MTAVSEWQYGRRNFVIGIAYGVDMTTAPRSVAVVATRLPITDRRALSQAWYSALHVPQAQGAAAIPKTRSTAPARAAVSPAKPVASAASAVVRPAEARLVAHRGAVTAGIAERRVPASDVARRIERAVAARLPAAVGMPASISVNAGDGRVQLLVRHDGTATRIVALCAPHLRERVDRALAHARFSLAAAGTPVVSA